VMTFGGGIGCFGASPTISDNTIAGNTVTTGAYVNGAGLGCWGGSPTILNNAVKGNAVAATTEHAGGGGVWCMAASETITGNVISGNQATYCGGGLKVEQETAPTTISGNTISNNSAPRGGGVYSWDSSLTFLNNVVSGNSASIFGGGFKFDEGATVTITNCTISGNSSAKGGGISFTDDNSLTLKNTIIAFSPAGGGLEWHSGASSSPTAVLTYCDLYGNTGGNYGNWPDQTGKNGNVSKNPLFANVTKSDFHEKSKGGRWNPALKAWVIDTVHSPCINAGDPASAFALEPAPNGGRINIGAYGNTAYASKSAPAAPPSGLLVSAAVTPVSGDGAQFSVNLSTAANVAVTLTNLAGRAVATLPQRDLPPGLSTLLWSGRGATGLRIPPGTYLARLTARTEDGSQGQALATVTVGR
ncbi:MAG: right-handed parallel beta-helix repeat-containing protein, partial [Armatimonadota bacterium]